MAIRACRVEYHTIDEIRANKADDFISRYFGAVDDRYLIHAEEIREIKKQRLSPSEAKVLSVLEREVKKHGDFELTID